MDGTTGEVTMNTDSNVNVYNEGGQRMSKTEEGEEERYFYTGSTILYTRNEHGDLRTENIVDPLGRIIASKRFDDDDDPGTTYELANLYFFYHYDIRGSVTAIIRPDGSLIEGYTYDEFGNLASTEYDSNGDPVEAVNEIFDNEMTFTGSITDTSTGLQYMNARYYDSTTGRFLSQDTYSGSPYTPWTQHLYSYCGNNPVNMIDPTGHFWYTVGKDGRLEQQSSYSNDYIVAKAKVTAATAVAAAAATVTAVATTGLAFAESIEVSWTYGYRYIGQSEYLEILQNGGYIPNTNANGAPKQIFTTPNKFNTVSEAVQALRIGEMDPNGPFENPVYRVEFRYENVTGVTTFRNVSGGKGIEVLSTNQIKVDNITELGNSFAAIDPRDDDFNNSNYPEGTGTGGIGLVVDEEGNGMYIEDQYGQRRPSDMSMMEYYLYGGNTSTFFFFGIPYVPIIPAPAGGLAPSPVF